MTPWLLFAAAEAMAARKAMLVLDVSIRSPKWSIVSLGTDRVVLRGSIGDRKGPRFGLNPKGFPFTFSIRLSETLFHGMALVPPSGRMAVLFLFGTRSFSPTFPSSFPSPFPFSLRMLRGSLASPVDPSPAQSVPPTVCGLGDRSSRVGFERRRDTETEEERVVDVRIVDGARRTTHDGQHTPQSLRSAVREPRDAGA